jgi:hypothetical protein
MHTTKGIAPLVIVLFLAFGLGGGYVYYKDPGHIVERVETLISPESPDEALYAMLDVLPIIRTVAFSGETSALIALPDPSMLMGLSGSKSMATASKGTVSLAWDGVADLATSTFAFSLNMTRSGEKPFSLALELRKPSRDVVYVLISRISQELAFLTESWVSFPLNKTMSANARANVEKALGKVANTEEKVRYITKLKEHRVLSVAEEFPKEMLHGVAVRHFKVVVNKVALGEFLEDVSGRTMSHEEEAQFDERLKQDELNNAYTEIWIGSYDHFPRKLEALPPKTEQSLTKLTLTFKDFNKPVVVLAPEGSKTFEEILGALVLKKAFPTGNIKGRIK